MTEVQYEMLVILAQRLKHTVSIEEPAKATLTPIYYNPLDKKEFIIVYDNEYKSSPINHPNNYYCNTFEELKTIVEWLIKYEEAYPDDKDFVGFPEE